MGINMARKTVLLSTATRGSHTVAWAILLATAVGVGAYGAAALQLRHLTLPLSPELENDVRVAIHRVILSSVLIMISGGYLTMFGLNRIMHKRDAERLQRLDKLVEAMSQGDYSRRLSVSGDDAIAEHASSLNQMVQVVEETERSLRRRLGEMEAQLESRTRELKRADAELLETWKRRMQAEKMTSLGRMAAGIAHEIRNPLNAIALTVSHIQDEFAPEDAEERKKFETFTENIQNEIRRLESLVKRSLTFSRRPRPRRQLVDVNQVLKEVLVLARAQAVKQGIELEQKWSQNSFTTMADGEQLQEAFWNLIANALQAMPEGGGKITVTSKLDPLRATMEFSFTDSGCGIPAADQEKIFDPYFTSKDRGVGLGLAIVRRIAEDHGGRVEVRSKEGEGSTFLLWLPVKGDLRGGSGRETQSTGG